MNPRVTLVRDEAPLCLGLPLPLPDLALALSHLTSPYHTPPCLTCVMQHRRVFADGDRFEGRALEHRAPCRLEAGARRGDEHLLRVGLGSGLGLGLGLGLGSESGLGVGSGSRLAVAMRTSGLTPTLSTSVSHTSSPPAKPQRTGLNSMPMTCSTSSMLRTPARTSSST